MDDGPTHRGRLARGDESSRAQLLRFRLTQAGVSSGAALAGGARRVLVARTRLKEETAVPQAKADRSAAGKKAAATREREQKKEKSEAAGKKAAGTRQGRAAGEAAGQAKLAAGGALSGAKSAVRAAGSAAKQAGKAAA
jgi:hypothetical protein